jgi:hypothetical protein
MSDKGKPFESTDLSVPSETLEHWRSLSTQMQPSTAPGSAPVSYKDNSHDAQWLRKLSFSVYASDVRGDQGTIKEAGIDLSALRVNFNVKGATSSTPGMLWARVYNMAPKTMADVIQFTRIQIKAGYRFAGFGVIFDGTVVQYRRGKENPTDTYLEIHGADGDDRLNRRMFSAWFPAGTEDKKIILEAAKQLGITVKEISPDVGTGTTLRDTTEMTTARAKLREMMGKYNARFFFEHGELVILSNDRAREGQAFVMSPKTGLVGLPEVTPAGIQVKSLLNPNIKIGSQIRIQNAVLSGQPFTPGSAVSVSETGEMQGSDSGNLKSGAEGKQKPAAMWGQQLETAYTSPTGTYKVVMLQHSGDTRGLPWYCDMTCVALDAEGKALMNPSTALRRAAPEAQPQGTRAQPQTPSPHAAQIIRLFNR